MRLTRIDLEGRTGYYATAKRKRYSDHIEVEILTPETPDGKIHHAKADCEKDIRSMAECIFFHLNGHDGSNSDIYDLYMRLLPLSDV